jgi:hypothetical protein
VLASVQTAFAASLGKIFVIDMENHNLVQPNPTSSPQQLLGNTSAPFLNSLMTPGNANAAQTSWASNYHNAGGGVHPSEPNYIWQEGGSNFGVAGDNDPYTAVSSAYPNGNVFTAPNLTGLLQRAGISWKSYQEDVDLTPAAGSVNQPNTNALTSTVAPQNQWTVPLKSFAGTSSSYINPYNGSHQYNYAAKHDSPLFYTATNGGTTTTANLAASNAESLHYAPLQQLTTDLNNSTVARYNLITPNLYNDAHSALAGGFTYHGTAYTGDQAAIAQGDNFLSIIIPQIKASAAYQNDGAIVIWWDETEGGDTSAYTIPDIVISPLAKGNAFNCTTNLTHSSDLKTMQEIFGVGTTTTPSGFIGDAASAGTNDLANLFVPGTVPVGVPEPASLTFLGMATICVFTRRRQRKAGDGIAGPIH